MRIVISDLPIIGKLSNLPFSLKIIASMSGTKSSAIWKYFEIPTEENKKYAKCKLCGEMKSLGSIIPRYRTLGCLKNHIKRIHKMEWPNLNQDLQNSTLISKSKIALAQQEFAKRLQGGPKAEKINNFDANNQIIPNISFMSKNGDLTVGLGQKRYIPEIEKPKICSNVLFSMGNLMT